MYKKIIMISIVLLFVGTGIIPGIQTNYQETMSGAITFGNNKEQQSITLLLGYNYYNYVMSPLADGTYYVRVRAEDAAGNFGPWTNNPFVRKVYPEKRPGMIDGREGTCPSKEGPHDRRGL